MNRYVPMVDLSSRRPVQSAGFITTPSGVKPREVADGSRDNIHAVVGVHGRVVECGSEIQQPLNAVGGIAEQDHASCFSITA